MNGDGDRTSGAWSDEWEESDQLDLAASDDTLPWLEADDDRDAVRGFDTSRLALLAGLAFVLLAALIGGIWFLANRGLDAEPAPDGSVIAAPAEPYKTRPDDAGGKTFAGTGDTSFAVGEGQSREGRLAAAPEPRNTAASGASDGASGAEGPSIASTVTEPAASAPRQASGVGVQVGAYFSREDAEQGWQSLTRQTESLSGVSHRVVEGQSDIGRVFRLQAVAGNRETADRLCRALQSDGLACQVK